MAPLHVHGLCRAQPLSLAGVAPSRNPRRSNASQSKAMMYMVRIYLYSTESEQCTRYEDLLSFALEHRSARTSPALRYSFVRRYEYNLSR